MNFPAAPASLAFVVTSDASNRDAARLVAVVAQLCLDMDKAHPRYGLRDVTGDGIPESWCNVALRDFCAAMGAPVEGARANDQVTWLASEAARARGWAEVSPHAAQGCAEEGFPVVVGWHSRGAWPGHVAVLLPSLGEDGAWIAQAGARCFSRGPLASGFGSRAVSYFAHP